MDGRGGKPDTSDFGPFSFCRFLRHRETSRQQACLGRVPLHYLSLEKWQIC